MVSVRGSADGLAGDLEEATASGVSILAVDDHPDNLHALRAMLSAPDYHITEVSSGAEALGCLLRGEYALVLLDAYMPGMNGFEVATLMRRRERTRSVPIIFLTGEALDNESVYSAYATGAIDYIVKPVDPLILRAKVAVFAELFRQKREICRQGVALAEAERQKRELAIAEIRLAGQQRENALLSEALRSRDEFLALASHELRSPLTPLLVHIQALLRTVREGHVDPDRAARGLEVAIRQVQRLARLVDQLLDVARIQADQLDLSPADVDLSSLAREVVEQHLSEAAKFGSDLRVSAIEPVIGRWDRDRLEQVLTNLLTNAIKFGTGKPIEVRVSGDGEWARIVVRDQGIGIAPDAATRIFNRFERAVEARHYGGLGLGLYITRRIVEAHHGSIRVESRPGEGATFTIDLPRLADVGAEAGAVAA
jgi:signal transduction histidine kinase